MENQDFLYERYTFLDEYFYDTPPDRLLFHYTDQQGLMGIIKEKELWATQIQYLNDVKEQDYAFELAISILNRKLGLRSQSDKFTLRDAFRTANKISSLITVDEGKIELQMLKNSLYGIWNETGVFESFIFSFSEREDLLSQWRGYCPKSGGFSLGLDLRKEWGNLQQQGYQISKCIYKRDQQKELVEKIFDEAFDEMKGGDPQDPEDNTEEKAMIKCLGNFSDIVPILKHPTFIEEQEWRIISTRHITGHSDIEYRPGNSLLIPFIKIPLVDENGNCPISEIYIGPAHHQNLSMKSVEGFLTKQNLARSCDVYPSEIPHREL